MQHRALYSYSRNHVAHDCDVAPQKKREALSTRQARTWSNGFAHPARAAGKHACGLPTNGQYTDQRGVPLRQASEQYFTASQQRSHLRRQTNSRPQTGHVLRGRSDFATARPLPLEGVLRMLPCARLRPCAGSRSSPPGRGCDRYCLRHACRRPRPAGCRGSPCPA